MTLRDGIYRVARIEWRLAPYDWGFPRDEAARIEEHWATRRRAAPGIYDGRVLLMRDAALMDGCFSGTCFETSYKVFLAWRDAASNSPGFPSGGVFNGFGMAALKSADSAFILGAMSAGTASAGKLYFPAGTPEPSDADADGRVDLAANVLRELEEETGLKAGEVACADDWTVVVAGARVGCMKLIRSAETAAELRARLATFNASQADPELVDLVPIASRADYDLARMPDFMVRYLDWAFETSDI